MKVNTMKINKEYLESINPTCWDEPTNFNYQIEKEKALRLADSLKRSGFEIRTDFDAQDANFLGDIGIEPYGAIRLSKFERLATITWEERFPEDLLNKIINIIGEHNYSHVPWHFFGEPFETRNRFNEDLFNQLFDYQ